MGTVQLRGLLGLRFKRSMFDRLDLPLAGSDVGCAFNYVSSCKAVAPAVFATADGLRTHACQQRVEGFRFR